MPGRRQFGATSGEWAEQRACDYLRRKGLRLLDRNYRCRRGEIDLIMADGELLVFVEVRYRKSARFGRAEETVDWRKRGKVIAAASHYLQTKNIDRPCRFDVIAIAGEAARLSWIKNAFEAE